MSAENKLSGHMNASGLKIAILSSRFNSLLVDKLVEGAIDALTRHGAKEKDITTVFVPGAWEIPIVAKKLAKSKKYDGIVCVGALIKGSTHHFEYIASEAVKGIAQVSLELEIPLTMGILTTDNLTQAIERSGATMGNQGYQATCALIELCNLTKII